MDFWSTEERNTLSNCGQRHTSGYRWAIIIGVLVTILLIFALLGTGSAAASNGDDGVEIGHSEGALANQSATHMWSYEIEADGELHEIRLDYSGTGTDVSGLTADDVHFSIGDDWNHQFETSVDGEEVLVLTLDESEDVTASEQIEVHANDEVINPEAGTYSAAIELYNESEIFSETTVDFEILAVGTLKGQVTNSSTGEPIAGATVEADNSSKNINIDTVTNETGWYSMDVANLTYDQITADADWYAYNRTRYVVVGSGEVNTTNASLDPAGAFTGTVTDTDGNVIERAKVNFENNTYPEIYNDRTAADGTFRVDVEPNNEYNLTAEANLHEDNESTSYTVSQGEEINVGTIELTLSDDPETINGTVTNASGDPIEGATITAKNQSVEQKYQATVHYKTETDASGEYAIDVPEGSTSVSVSAPWYGENETIADAPAVDVNLILEQTGTLTGTIEDSSGDGIADAMVSVYPPEGGQGLDLDHTDSDGSYSLTAPPGTYSLGIFHDDYPDEFHRDVEIIGAEETVEDYTLQDPGEITGVVRDENGDPVQGVDVSTHDTTHTNFDNSETDASGEFTLTVAPGTYEVTVRPDEYPVERSSGITVEEGDSADVAFDLIEPTYISGEVRNESGSLVGDVFVIAQSDGNTYFDHSQDGEYNLSVPSGSHRVMVLTQDGYVPGEDIETQPGEIHQNDFTLLNVTVLDESVEVISGPGDEGNIGVNAGLNGALNIWLTNESGSSPYGMPNELEGLDVTDDTEFEINITVKNFDPDSLLWAGEDVAWETSENETADNATDITIRTKAVHMEGVEYDGAGNPVHIGPVFRQNPSDIRWPSDQHDTATIGWNQTVYLGMFDQSNVPESIQESLQGMTVATNAQAFSMPTVTDDSLEVWVGGPSRTTEGEPHDGLYQAFIPDDLLDTWGVDDPEADLEALYRGDSTDFTVTETTDGAWIEIDDISYSAGFIEVEADSEETDPSPTPSSTPSPSSSSSVDPGPEPEIIEDPSELAAVDVPAGVEAQRSERIDIAVNEDTGVSQATFSDASAVESITFSDVAEGSSEVTEIDREPAETGSAPGGSVSTMQISVPDEAKNSAATIRTRVSQDRLNDIAVDAADLRINRFNAEAGEWQRLETDLIEETDERVVLEAETPGFSIFTVSAVGQPTAVIDAPTEVEEDVEIILDGGDSSSPYSDIKAYEWTIKGESFDGESVTTAFDTPGEYTVTLTVMNEGDETDTVETTITVREAAGVADSDSVSESEPQPESQSEPEEVPGFGIVVALLSLIVASLLAARQHN